MLRRGRLVGGCRSVHSTRLDDSLLWILPEIRGDLTFLRWHRRGLVVRVDAAVDVPRAVYEQAVVCKSLTSGWCTFSPHRTSHRSCRLAAGGIGERRSCG
jgi:hypothetical protein